MTERAHANFNCLFAFTETSMNNILAGNEASATSAEDLYFNMNVLLPTCISILIIFLVVMLLCVVAARKKSNSASIYGNYFTWINNFD